MPDDFKRVKKYISFKDETGNQFAKTKVFNVYSGHQNITSVIGKIKWYGGFRKYVFYPYDLTFFDSDGLKYIGSFVEDLNKKHYGKGREQRTKGDM